MSGWNPLHADLYEANGATYRRPPYRGLSTQPNQLPVGGGDTRDLYDSDDLDSDDILTEDGPVCGVDENRFASHKPRPADLDSDDLTTSEIERENKERALGKTPATMLATRPWISPEMRESAEIDRQKQKSGVVETPAIVTTPPPGFVSLKPLAQSLPKADVRVTKDGAKWTGYVHAPCNLHGLIMGRGFATARKMQNDTRCRITMPPRGSDNTMIHVESSEGAENVSRCLDMIEAIVISGTKAKWTKTHFVAIPCTFRIVRNNFHKFENLVMEIPQCDESMKNRDLFPDSAKLHMTVAMICMQTDKDKEIARETVKKIQEKYKDIRPLAMEIDHLDIMNDDPEQVHVLFAGAKPDERVQAFFDDVRLHFFKAGLMSKHEKENESVKLHMTVMNSRYALPENTEYDAAKHYSNRKPFNVRGLLERHPDWPFGFIDLDTITICELGTTNEETGYYETFLDEKVGKIPVDHYKNYPKQPKWTPKPRQNKQ